MAENDDKAQVRTELEDLAAFMNAEGFGAAQVKDGTWFGKFLFHVMSTYAKKVDARYFEERYPGLPADAIVDRRVDLAKKYAAIEGGVTSTAYSAAVAATVGTGGGASPVTLPGAVATFLLDTMFLTKLQLNLAYDISVLYRVPIDMDDPEDLYDLFRVALGIKAGEVFNEALSKLAPETARQAIKAVFRGQTLLWLKALPVVGKHLLQRNILKFGIPLLNFPLTTVLNYYWTGAIATRARQTFRDKARSREAAEASAEGAEDAWLLCVALYAVLKADGHVAAEEAWFLKDLVRELKTDPENEEALAKFKAVIDLRVDDVVAKVRASPEREAIYRATCVGATMDRRLHPKEELLLRRLAEAADVAYDRESLVAMTK